MEFFLSGVKVVMARKYWQHIAFLMFGAAALLFFYSYMHRLHPDVAYMDSLRLLGYFDDSETGKKSIFSTWNQGQHRWYIGQFFVYLNAKFFDYNIYLSALSSGFPIVVTGLLLSYEQFRTISKIEKFEKSPAIVYFLSFVTFVSLFSLANWEIYSLDVGAALFLKNCLVLLYWMGVDRALRNEISSPVLNGILLFFTPILLLFFVGGWVYAITISTMCCVLLSRPSTDAAKAFKKRLLLLLVLSLACYVLGKYFPVAAGIGGGYAPPGLVFKFSNILESFVLGFSSIFIGGETAVEIKISIAVLFSVGVFCVLALVFLLVNLFNLRDRIPFVPVALLLYSLLTLAAISIARGGFDPVAIMSSRYYMDFSLFFVSLLWLSIIFFGNNGVKFASAKVLMLMMLPLLIIFFVGQFYTGLGEWKKAPYRNAYFQEAVNVTLGGVKNSNDVAILQSDDYSAKNGVEVQRKYGLGPFAHISCDTPMRMGGWIGDGDGKYWIEEKSGLVVKNCSRQLSLKILNPAVFRENTLVVFVDGESTLRKVLPSGQLVDISFPLPDRKNVSIVELKLDFSTKPSETVHGSNDGRKLGVLVIKME